MTRKERKMAIFLGLLVVILSAILTHQIFKPSPPFTFLIAHGQSSKEIQDRANLICGESDCSDGINALLSFIPRAGGLIKFTAGTFLMEAPMTFTTKISLKGQGSEVTTLSMDNIE